MDTDRPDADAAVAAGVDHLQRAAHEALAAVRSLLDAAERVIDDPATLQAVLGTLGAVARSATETVTSMAAQATAAPQRADGTGSRDEGGAGGGGDDGGFERIRVH